MYTVAYVVNLFICWYTVRILFKMIQHGVTRDRVVIVIVLALWLYILLCSNTFATFLRTFTLHPQKDPIPIGSGWSFYLNRLSTNSNFVFCPLQGLQPNGRWGAATLIKDVQKELTARLMTLTSHPSVENGTIGGWIASGSHGSGGTMWKSNFGTISVKDLSTDDIFDIRECSEIFNDDTSIDSCRKYLILDVQVNPVPDVWCKTKVFKMNSEDDAYKYMKDDSYLRMVQIGRRGMMILMWIPLKKNDNISVIGHPPQFSLWFQADILSMLQSSNARYEKWFNFPVEANDKFESKVKLSEANRFTYESPIMLSPIGLAFTNFEVFIIDYNISAHMLYKLCNSLSDMFTKLVKGRCELRGGHKKLFLDFVVVRTSNVTCIFEKLLEILGPCKIRLHKGKAQVDTYPFLQ